MPHGLDTNNQVFFYEQEFYVLSNFSAFRLGYRGLVFPTSEHAYQWEKFPACRDVLRIAIAGAPSAHDAFRLARENDTLKRHDWDHNKVWIMKGILRTKALQHEYVRRKLLETGGREIVENSWRDDFWGWGPNRDGKNMLGQLWMEIRQELREADKKED